MFIGVDLGSTLIKTSKDVKFLSGISYDDIDISGGIKVEYEGSKYTLGMFKENVDISVDINKRNNKNILINFYAALAMSTPDNVAGFNIIVGYPIGQYSKNKSEFKDMLTKNRNILIVVDGYLKKLTIESLDVFPECAGAFYSPYIFNEEPTLIIDIGGLTVNWVYFKEKELMKYGCFKMGMMVLYDKLAAIINSNFGTNKNITNMYDTLKDGLYLEGSIINFETLLSKDIELHINEILNSINLIQSVNEIKKVYFIGGGLDQIGIYVKNMIPYAEVLGDSLFYNAYGFEEIAKVKL